MVLLTSALHALADRLQLSDESPLLRTAVTHSSYASEHDTESNERLEFLGDAVVNLAIADAILRDYPELNQGTGSLARSRVVNEATLAEAARALGLSEILLLGRGEAKHGGATRPSLLADAFEAVVAALYLERGHAAANEFVQTILAPALAEAARSPHASDPKSQLRQWAEAQGLGAPVYTSTVSGPEHDPTFDVEVRIAGERKGRGTGRSKKIAEAAAALAAWEGQHNA